MKDTRVASRYAKSLIDLALEKGELEQAYTDMQLIYTTCKSSKTLSLLLKSPVIKSDKKIKMLDALFSSHISCLSFSFIKIITKKRRESYLYAIAKNFIEQYKQHKNILTTVITTASGLDESLRKKVISVVKRVSHCEVDLEENINSNLIGGFILQMEDKQMDYSIARQLKKLKRNFDENLYIKEF